MRRVLATRRPGTRGVTEVPPVVPSVVSAGPFSDANYFQTTAGSLSGFDLGANSTLVLVMNPVDPDPIGADFVPICYRNPGALGTHGWLLDIIHNGDAPQVAMIYIAGGVGLVTPLGTLTRVPGQPVRIVFVDDGTSFRVTVNGSAVVTLPRAAYSAGTATERANIGNNTPAAAGYGNNHNTVTSFAILHRAISDAEAIQESSRLGSWDVALSTDAACTVDGNITRDYTVAGSPMTTRGTSPVTFAVTGTVARNTVTQQYLTVPLTRPNDTGIWTPTRNCNVDYYRCTQQARWLIDTDAEELIVQQIVTEGAPYYTDIAVRIVGGATPTPVQVGAVGFPYPMSGAFVLGSGGVAKVVELVASVQSNIGAPLDFLGGFPFAVNVPVGRSCSVRAATTPTNRLLIYGDSMVAERPSNPEINGVGGLLRLDYPGQVTIDAALNRSLYDDLVGGGLGLTALVARHSAELDGTVSNTLVVWIGLEDHWRSLYTKANFTIALNSYLVAMRAARPDVTIFVITRTDADAPYNTNTYGDTVAQWRTATSDACVGVSNCTVIDSSTLATFNSTNFNAADSATAPNRVHFTTAGAATFKAGLKTALGY